MHHHEQSQGNACNGSTREGGVVWRGCSGGCDAEDGAAGALTDGNLNPGDKLEGSGAAPDDPVHLKRRVGLFSGVALIVGTMIGSGIFVAPSGLLEYTDSVGISFIIWMACGLLSLLGALAYAELGTMNTSSGAEYAYFMDAFGGPPAFLFSWVSTLVLKPSQMAIICLSFAKYAVEPFVAECEPPGALVKLVAVICIVMILAVNCYSVNLATNVQNIFTAAKLVAVLIIVCGGAYKLGLGNTRHLQEPNFASSKATLGNIAIAFYNGLWAYDGWNNLNYVTEEIKNPSKNLPLSIIIGIPLVTLCYALMNVSYLAVMSVSEMTSSEAVAVTFGNRVLGPLAWLMPLAVTISTFGSANGTLFVAGRLCFAASREGHLLDILSYVHVRRFTPAPGLIFHSLIAVAMVLYGTIDSLIEFFSFTAWIFYGGAMLALIVMRYTKPHAPRPYKVPVIIPYIVLLVSVYLVVGPVINKPQWEYLYATAFILTGLLVYVPFVKWSYSLPFMDKITVFLQMVLEVVPTSTTFEY
ncbi:PREDICTED: b(0,+)-type amino acid transporter 1-like isoform X2 [Papilio xuthus]|uniref:b(0,+)-type amino acid transporter 1 n=1 Tax=Papilio xuthus TaxID=66420 RepID=A0AAJ7E8K7_PAPXU|nr:PREDICTED: b(0,+)-type amino acid transporter 1-like isoform X2 [Papilio xuthus]